MLQLPLSSASLPSSLLWRAESCFPAAVHLSPNGLRTLLVLGRVSNLPTIWSNCLAAWLLGNGGAWSRFFLVCGSATLLYIGGMFLNDAFDAGFDQQHRRERPIPTGAISTGAVWRLGFLWLALGIAWLLPLGSKAVLLGLLLAVTIIIYDAVHKLVTFSPVLMAMCRFLLYLLAASAAKSRVTGIAIWSGAALAAYVVGLSYLARKESTGGGAQRWPILLLAAPLLLAYLVNDGMARRPGLLASAILILWSVRSLRPMLSAQKNVGRTVAGLLAGIVWVDVLAVAVAPPTYIICFVGLFLLALLFQRFVPAT